MMNTIIQPDVLACYSMQITSSLLSNLLDVVEEVQSARIEIRNLVDAKFYAHSGKQKFSLLFKILLL